MPKRSSPSRSNRPGPKPKVIVSRLGQVPERLAGVVGRHQRLVVAIGPASSPAVMRAAAAVHARSSSTELGAVLGGDVEGGEVQAVLRGGHDPGLALAPERDRAGAVAARDSSARLVAEREAAGAEPEPGAGDARRS